MLLTDVWLGPSVAPVDEVQCFPWDGECTMLMHFSKNGDNPGGLRNPQTSAQLSGMDPGPHSGVGPGGVGKAQSVKAFINSTEVVFASIPPCSTIEITCNQVNFLRNHNGTKSEDKLLGDAFLLGVDVADM